MKIDESFLTSSRLGAPLELGMGSNVEGGRKSNSDGFQNLLDDLMEASQEASSASRAETAKLLTGTLEDFP